MKIVFVVNELDFFLRTHINLASNISRIHDVELIADTSNSSGEDLDFVEKMGIKLNVLNRKKNAKNIFSYLSFISSLLFMLRRIKPDYIFYITLEISFFGSLISHFIKIKKSIFIVTGLGPFFFKKELKYRFFNMLQRYSFRILNTLKKNFHFIFLNSDDKELLTSLYKINSLNFSLIHGEGIDRKEFRYVQRDISVPRFLLASRLIRSKGIECYIAAAKRIKTNYPHVKFSIAGIFNIDNPESISMKLYEEIKTDVDINFLGEISHKHMEKCLHENNVFVLPSEREGLPRVVTEAASTGMPLILSNVPGCKDCIINNKSGILVNYMDEDQLYNAMKCFVDDIELIALMGQESAKFAGEKFSIETITKQYLEIIS
jgi:glycosyltransferase involved in cell wall biosynthesis